MMPVPKTRRFRSIACGVDLSAQSAKALRYAGALARICGGRVTAVYAVDPLLSTAAAVAYDTSVIEASAHKDLARFVRLTLGAAGAARVDCVVAVGKPRLVMIDQARRLHADVVVLGTNARRGVRGLFFGSTTQAVLRRFRGATLVIPPRCRLPRAGWPRRTITAAVGEDTYRRTGIAAAARMAEMFGAWLSLVPDSAAAASAVASRAELVLYPLPRAARLAMFGQGSAAYHFICAARAPVMVLRASQRAQAGRRPIRRAA